MPLSLVSALARVEVRSIFHLINFNFFYILAKDFLLGKVNFSEIFFVITLWIFT